MFKTSQIFPKIKAFFQYAHFSAIGIVVLILFVIIFTYFLLVSPVSIHQKANVRLMASQAEFPFTQQMAKKLLQHTLPVNKMQYFRLIRAYEHERCHVRNYPAYDPNRVVR